jgi:hypothetical protein
MLARLTTVCVSMLLRRVDVVDGHFAVRVCVAEADVAPLQLRRLYRARNGARVRPRLQHAHRLRLHLLRRRRRRRRRQQQQLLEIAPRALVERVEEGTWVRVRLEGYSGWIRIASMRS